MTKVKSVPQQSALRLREVTAKSIISPSKISVVDYAINPYAGCEHGCVYCYARFAARFSHPGEAWGSFVDVRINAVALIQREAPRKRRGTVFVSSVCDGWQPLEAKYRLTRRCVAVLLQNGYPLNIQTKSALVQRDFDLLRGQPGVDLGVTLTTLEPKVAALFEPKASPPADRIKVMVAARGIGVRTFVFLGPLLPYISDRGEGLDSLLDTVIKINPDYFLVDRLNPHFRMWPDLSAALSQYDPALVAVYKQIIFGGRIREMYTEELRRRISQQAGRHGLSHKMRWCF